VEEKTTTDIANNNKHQQQIQSATYTVKPQKGIRQTRAKAAVNFKHRWW